MDEVTITLPLPHKSLSPNYTVGSRGARLGKAAQTKRYRGMAASHVKGACDGEVPSWSAALVECKFYYATSRRRDKDNALASMKAAFDGIADSGLVQDDSDITYLPVRMDKDKERPRVELTIRKAKQ